MKIKACIQVFVDYQDALFYKFSIIKYYVISHPEFSDKKLLVSEIGKEEFFVLARKSRDCAEAYKNVRRTSNAAD